MDIRVYIRHLQLFNTAGTPIVYSGNNPASLAIIPGTVPQTTWIDVTADVANRDKFGISFTVKRDSAGAPSSSGLQAMKAATQPLTFEGEAYAFIKAWLIDSVSAPHNRVEVKISDVGCGEYLDLSIRSTDISWCTGDTTTSCSFDVIVKYTDPDLFCVQNTTIDDNHQGWFDVRPANGKKHPRFSYCNEERPNAKLIVFWYLIRTIADISYVVFGVIYAVLNVLIVAINAIIKFLRALGFKKLNTIDQLDFNNIVEFFNNLYIEAAGCGREHPAPLVRDYISNVCTKCGITVDATSAPIFFARQISLKASTRDLTNVNNPHYNACYMTAKVVRGIRRFENNGPFANLIHNDTDFYIPDNTPLLNLSDFLDRIKQVYNAEWRIAGGVLYFWRKDWFLEGPAAFDFVGADRDKMLDGMCFEWSELKQGAAARGLYALDPGDSCGNEALRQMNGMVGFARTDNNPNYEGIIDKTTQFFGGTKFRLDGASTDYIYDAAQSLANGQVFSPSTIPQLRALSDHLGQYADYALLLRDETSGLDKLLIWDEESYTGARCVRNVVPVNNYLVPGDPVPEINPKYNQDSDVIVGPRTPEQWVTRHPAETKVIGSSFTPGGAPPGVYIATDYFNQLVMSAAARLVNYPMYFEPGYLDTLWDWFHWIDDPIGNPQMRLAWTAKIDLCCENLARLNIFNKLGGGVKLPAKVILPIRYYPDGKIEEVHIEYNSEGEVGKHIELKGTA